MIFNSTETKIGDGNNLKEIFSNALNALMHNDSYNHELFLGKDKYLIGCTRYPEYPILISENKEFWICLEGKIYDKKMASISDEIFTLVKHVFNKRTDAHENRIIIADWLLSKDGDFIIYALDKLKHEFVIINDVLGRLPFYYYDENGVVIGSREIQFISKLIDNFHLVDYKFDKLGMAELLLFCHTLGRRTLLKSVNRLEPASLLRIQKDDLKNKFKVQVENMYSFNFEGKRNASITVEASARELTSLFLEACNNRVDHSSKNIISLSGGFDSRAVAAALYRNKIKSYAVTSTEPHWRPVDGAVSETEIAEKIARVLNIEWENYGTMVPRAEHMLKLLKLKMGLTYVAHSFLLPFLDLVRIKHHNTSINFFTGHGGDVLFANLIFPMKSIDYLVKRIIRVKGFFNLAEVAALIGIKEVEIIDEIKNILCSYPEENLSQKLVHYLFFESNIKFSFEIEDINRSYFWSVAPFYSIPFFTYIMNCSDNIKSKNNLYREFLLNISHSVADIKNSNWGCSILSKKFRILQGLMGVYWKYPRLRKVMKKLKDKRGYTYKENSKIIRCMRDQVRSCKQISDHLSRQKFDNVINNCSNYNHYGIDNLFSISAFIENIACKSATIKKYYGADNEVFFDTR